MTYTLSTTLDLPYDAAVAATREALGDQGFGVLTEIDLKATLKEKLDVDLAPHVILGACNPSLAHQALGIDPSIGTVLPCNVAVRSTGESTTVVEAFDPDTMTRLAGDQLDDVAADARRRLVAALEALSSRGAD